MIGLLDNVAPYAGAWIEILAYDGVFAGSESLPTRERGLKYRNNIDHSRILGRSLRGSVD